MGSLKGSLDANGTVHLCIDMQRLFAPDGPWPTPWMPRVLPVVTALLQKAPERAIFTRFVTAPSPEEAPGMWQAYYRKWHSTTRLELDAARLDLMPELQCYAPPARIMNKLVYSAFGSGELHPFLLRRNVHTLIVTGSETDVCVLSSALAAVDYRYRVIIVRDGVCSSSDESHDALIELFTRRFDLQTELAASEEILDAWRPG
jgi:nicotinamidase-related amidase